MAFADRRYIVTSMTESAAAPVPPDRRLLAHLMIFALVGPGVGTLAVCFTAMAAGVFDAPGWSVREMRAEADAVLDALPTVLPFGYVLGLIPSFVAGAAVALTRGRRLWPAWAVATVAGGLGTVLGLGWLGWVGMLAVPAGVLAALVCTALTAPLVRWPSGRPKSSVRLLGDPRSAIRP